MKAFFNKYPVDLKESTAIKMIIKVLEKALEDCKEKDDDYLAHMAKAEMMLSDFFEEKNIDPETLL